MAIFGEMSLDMDKQILLVQSHQIAIYFCKNVTRWWLITFYRVILIKVIESNGHKYLDKHKIGFLLLQLAMIINDLNDGRELKRIIKKNNISTQTQIYTHL